MGELVVVGAGWLGSAIAAAIGTTAIPRRSFVPTDLPRSCRLVVASGRARVGRNESYGEVLATELGHLRRVIEGTERAAAERVVVLGSADVRGGTGVIDGAAGQDPRTQYGNVKAALEDECRIRADQGAPLTSVRLAPVHGPGKRRTASLLRTARLAVTPLPNAGRHSVAFVIVPDVVAAVDWLLRNDAPAVQSVGGGQTRLVDLLRALAEAQGRTFRGLPVPVPADASGRILGAGAPEWLHWLNRLSSPRLVPMDPPVTTTPVERAARFLVGQC